MADLLLASLPEKAASLRPFLPTLPRRLVGCQPCNCCYTADAAREAYRRSTTTADATLTSANKTVYPLSLEQTPEATFPPLQPEAPHCSRNTSPTSDYEQRTAAAVLKALVRRTRASPQGVHNAHGGRVGAALAAAVIAAIAVARTPWLVIGASAGHATKLIPYKLPLPLGWVWWIAAAFLCAGLLFTAKFITYTLRIPTRDRSLVQELLHAAGAALMLGLAISFILISSGVYY